MQDAGVFRTMRSGYRLSLQGKLTMSYRRLFGVFYLSTLLFVPACAPEAPPAASQKAGEVEAEAATPAASQPTGGAVEELSLIHI